MRLRAFGNTGMEVSELGLGCARIGGIFQSGSAGFVELLNTAHDLGINFFDTADMYCQGESEQLIGRAFKRRRQRIIIASKVGYVLPGRRRLIARVKPLVRPIIRALGIQRARLSSAVSGQLTQDFGPAHIRKAVEASLRRLRTDYLDLLQLHSPATETISRGEWLQSLQDLQRAGKIRFFGISCDSVAAAEAALVVPGLSSLQVVVNLLERGMEPIAAKAKARAVPVIARECLANGLLVKDDADLDYKRYCSSPEVEAARRAELGEHRATAKQRGVPLSALALEYAANVDGVAVALVGASRTEQLRRTVAEYRGRTATST